MKSSSPMFSKSVRELIESRTSWRKYTGDPISPDIQNRINEFLARQTQGFFGDGIRFRLVASTPTDADELKGLGTYGFISGAPGFIIGAIKKSNSNLEDYGFLLQKIILFLTDLGLGSCWLGGTFYKDNFSRRIEIQEDEVVPAVISVGHPTDKRGMVDNLIRRVAKSKTRKNWDELFFINDFSTPLAEGEAGIYSSPLEMLRLSPSASNKQPWRVVFEKNKRMMHFFLQRTKGYHKPSLFSDLQRVDMGIGMCHFELTCRDEDIKGNWIYEDPKIILPENTFYIVSWKID